MSNDNLILCVGAGGHFAGLVVPELAQRGAKVRGLFTRKASATPFCKAAPPKL